MSLNRTLLKEASAMTGPCGPLVYSSRLYDGDSWLEPPSLLPDP